MAQFIDPFTGVIPNRPLSDGELIRTLRIYASCVGMKAIGWTYPPGSSLPELIDRANLHPITGLTNLTKSEKSLPMQSGIVLCDELLDHPEDLASVGAAGARRVRILQEAGELCRDRNNDI